MDTVWGDEHPTKTQEVTKRTNRIAFPDTFERRVIFTPKTSWSIPWALASACDCGHDGCMIQINDDVTIEANELEFEYARSSGPGGQNVNKVETKATLRFSLADSCALTEEQKELIRERLPGRITKKDVLRVMCQRHRTREANRKECLDRFAWLLAEALTEDPERRPTRVPRKTKRRRLENKKHRSRLKATRGKVERE